MQKNYTTMNVTRLVSLLVLLTLAPLFVLSQNNTKVAVIAYYNLENLFDTIDSPDTNDAEFLPNGKNLWNTDKYYKKLSNMSRVISEIGNEYIKGGPTIIGVSEIENRAVLEDLISTEALKNSGYGIIHKDSPDYRGIDVALLYKVNSFRVINVTYHELYLDYDPNYRTRLQLCATGLLDNDTISVIVNHWPSRGNDEKYRVSAAQLTRKIVDSLYTVSNNARIFVIGDFNDDPVDRTILKVLGATGKDHKVEDKGLYNPMWKLFKKGVGSLAYRDSWNIFDQIIISKPLLDKNSKSWFFHKAHVFNKPYLIAKDGQYKGYPLRTYSYGIFINGYSDHLPVYVVIGKYIE